MTDIKVCFWNIQNYGSGPGGWTMLNKWGPNSGLRNLFIAELVVRENIDLLWIMEATQDAVSSLTALIGTLNAAYPGNPDWAMSLVACGLAANSPNPPTAPGNLTFASDARSEGYAVLWRRAQARFTVLPAPHDLATATLPAGTASPINLTTFGRPADMVDGPGGADYRAQAGYSSAGAFPCDSQGQQMQTWPKLTMPTTGKYNPRQLKMYQVRRPAYVVLEFDAPPTRCPVSVYHAPSNRSQAEWGALKAGLGRDLYVTGQAGGALQYAPNALIGGDFNYKVPEANWPQFYRYFTQRLGQNSESGAEMTEIPAADSMSDADRMTTVRLMSGDNNDQPIMGNVVDDYLSLAIDLVFMRGDIEAERLNVPQMLLVPNPPYPFAGTMKALLMHLMIRIGAIAPGNVRFPPTGPEELLPVQGGGQAWFAMLTGSWGARFADWMSFLASLNAGQIIGTPQAPAARQAAELYHMFFSDHLPLVATISY